MNSENPKSVLIVGYGNPLRSDDGLGGYVAERLAAQWIDVVEVLIVHQLTPELAETITNFSLVIFVDAMNRDGRDAVRCDSLTPFTSAIGLTHHCTAQAILTYAKMLYSRWPLAFLISVSGENFDHGDRLTLHAQKAAEAAIQCANALIEEHQNARR